MQTCFPGIVSVNYDFLLAANENIYNQNITSDQLNILKCWPEENYFYYLLAPKMSFIGMHILKWLIIFTLLYQSNLGFIFKYR